MSIFLKINASIASCACAYLDSLRASLRKKLSKQVGNETATKADDLQETQDAIAETITVRLAQRLR